MICDSCRKYFMSGNRPWDGLPNGVKMMLDGKKGITLCADCIIKLGQMSEKEKDAFITELKKKAR